jgi:putative toxin-antitoxin system antitoxin component (TIGR02293 family)
VAFFIDRKNNRTKCFLFSTKVLYLGIQKRGMGLFVVEDVQYTYGSTPKERSVLDIIKSVREGMRYDSFAILSLKMPFTVSEWSSFLHVSERTMLRYKNDNLPFDASQTDKIYQLSIIYEKGLSVFGEKVYFDIWLNTQNVALGGLKPKDLLDNSFGIGLVSDELIRIEHGVLA